MELIGILIRVNYNTNIYIWQSGKVEHWIDDIKELLLTFKCENGILVMF